MFHSVDSPTSTEAMYILQMVFLFFHFTIATIAAIAAMVRLRGLGLCCAAFASLRPQLHVAAGAARRQGRPQSRQHRT